MWSIIIAILVGAAAGWLAGVIMKGGGFGFLINLLIGIVGGFLGSWLFGLLNISIGDGIIGSLIGAVVGACLLLFIISLFKKK